MKLWLKFYLWLSREERQMRMQSHRHRRRHEAFLAESTNLMRSMFKDICRDLDEAERLLSR